VITCIFLLTLGETTMAALKGSKTEDNLKAAFAGESQALFIFRKQGRR
jgi:hypothetical protein